MRKITTCVLALAALALLAAALFWPRQEAAPAASVDRQPARYLVKGYEGRVAVFLPRQTYGPKYVTGILVSDLPEADRDRLQSGVPVYSDAQLTALLEDLGS